MALAVSTLLSPTFLRAAPQFGLTDVWNSANSDIGGNAGPEPHFVYGIAVDWRDHVLIACEGRFNQGTPADLALYGGLDGGPKNLLVKISRDRGVTWSADAIVEGNDGKSWTNPAFVVDGTTTYIFYTGSLDGSGKDVFYREVYNNYNAGTGQWTLTFGPRVDLTTKWGPLTSPVHGWILHGAIGHGIKKVKEPNRGRVMLPFHHRTGNTSSSGTALYGNDVLFKDPGGDWTLGDYSETPLEQEGGDPADDVGAGESRIAERANGSLFLVARKIYNFLGTTAHPEYRPRMRTAGNSLPNAIAWNNWVNAVGITGTLKVDGGLLRYSDTAHLYSFSNNEGHSERLNMAVRLSTDGGVNWPGSPKVIYGGDNAANYSDLARDSLGNIYCIFGRDGGSHNQVAGAKVTIAKFNLEWVTGTATPTIRIDNGGTGFSTTGTWTTATTAPGHYGPDYLTAPSGSATARWTPTINHAGNYEVYIRWTAGSDRADAVPIKVKYGTNPTALPQSPSLNQKTEGGNWHYVGTYDFPVGTSGYVQIDATDAGTTVADCVIFQKQ